MSIVNCVIFSEFYGGFVMIYERIKKLAKQKGYSINRLEEEVGFSRGSLCKIDTHNPSSEKIQKLAKFLGTTPDYIMTGRNPENLSDDIALVLSELTRDTETLLFLKEYLSLNEEKRFNVRQLVHLLNN